MAQFRVPQKIDLEDKIFGPLTLMQFIYLMAGGMVIYAAFETMDTAIFWIIAVPVAILTLCLTFIKIQDQPFSKFVTSAAMFFVKPRTRHWYKNPEEEKFAKETMPKETTKTEHKIEHRKVEKSELDKLAGVLDISSMEKIAAHQGVTLKNTDKKTPINTEKTTDIFQ